MRRKPDRLAVAFSGRGRNQTGLYTPLALPEHAIGWNRVVSAAVRLGCDVAATGLDTAAERNVSVWPSVFPDVAGIRLVSTPRWHWRNLLLAGIG